MERRRFIEKIFSFLALVGILLLGTQGCEKYQYQKLEKFGNQEKLWHLATGQEKLEEPIDLAYSKETPAFYRDASKGKADPSFVPKVGGG